MNKKFIFLNNTYTSTTVCWIRQTSFSLQDILTIAPTYQSNNHWTEKDSIIRIKPHFVRTTGIDGWLLSTVNLLLKSRLSRIIGPVDSWSRRHAYLFRRIWNRLWTEPKVLIITVLCQNTTLRWLCGTDDVIIGVLMFLGSPYKLYMKLVVNWNLSVCSCYDFLCLLLFIWVVIILCHERFIYLAYWVILIHPQ